MNLKIREFEQAIVNFINQSEIPMEVKRLVVADIMNKLQESADTMVDAELHARNEESKKQEDSDGKDLQ